MEGEGEGSVVPMTSQSFCSLSVSLLALGLIGTSGNRLTGFSGLMMLLCVGVFEVELSVLNCSESELCEFNADTAGGGRMFENQLLVDCCSLIWLCCKRIRLKTGVNNALIETLTSATLLCCSSLIPSALFRKCAGFGDGFRLLASRLWWPRWWPSFRHCSCSAFIKLGTNAASLWKSGCFVLM